MSATLDRCGSCHGFVDVEDLFCANCGTEVDSARTGHTTRLATRAHNFACRGCGATMNYDAAAQSLKCPFCGSVDLVEEVGSPGLLAPAFVVPFAIDRDQAVARLRSWLGSSFWHPSDLRQTAQLTALTAVFVPFWVFTSRVATHWTADTDQTPAGARADWFPISGRAAREYADLWVPASQGIDPNELLAVMPFDNGASVPPDRVDLENITVEQFTVSRRYARPLAQGRLEQLEAEAVAREIGGRTRNVHVNVLMEGATSRPALVPIYVMAYRFRERVYRFVLNGQTGQAHGTAPVSTAKVAAVVGLLVLALIVAFLLFAS